VTRQGTRYDKQLVHLAEKWLQDGTKTFVKRHADDLWKCAMDGDKLTERERETLRYILGKFPFEDEAKEHLAKLTDPPPSGSSFNIEVDGKQLHRVIWDLAMRHTQDGVLDVDEAKDLWETIVKDDKQVTTCQLTTLDMVLHKKHCSHNAIAFLMEKFEQHNFKSEAVLTEEELVALAKEKAKAEAKQAKQAASAAPTVPDAPIMLMTSSAAPPVASSSSEPPMMMMSSAPPPPGVTTPDASMPNDEFMILTKKWVEDRVNDDDFFVQVAKFLPAALTA